MPSKTLRPLTAKNIDKWLRAGVRAKHLDRGSKDSVRGLMLDIRGPRAASWTLRYQLNKSATRHLGLGSAFLFSLAEARIRAKRERQRLVDKIDPLALRRSEQAAIAAQDAKRLTFAVAAGRWHEAMRPGWSSVRHANNVMQALSKWAIPILKLDVAEIETAHVLKVLQQPVENREDSPIFWTAHARTADRVRNYIKLILDWAAVAGHRSQAAPNPARWTGHLEIVLPAPSAVSPAQNQPALPYAKVPGLMQVLASRESVGAMALRFVILTACRMSEATGARWTEVDFDNAVWTVPAERMKSRKEWRQPLAPQVVDLLRSLPTEADNPYLFIGTVPGQPLNASAPRTLLQRAGYPDIVAHGFRSSFSTWANERTSHSNHAIELSLAHTVGNEVERAYRRGDLFDKRRKLMADWATYVTTPPAVARPDNVIGIGAGR
jgi:integrase